MPKVKGEVIEQTIYVFRIKIIFVETFNQN